MCTNPGLHARSHQTLDVLCDREVILYANAQHLQTTSARYSRQQCRFGSGCSMVSPSPAVSEDDLGRLSLGPLLHVVELCGPRRLIAGRDDDVRVVGLLAHRISWHRGDDVSGGDDVGSWSNV